MRNSRQSFLRARGKPTARELRASVHVRRTISQRSQSDKVAKETWLCFIFAEELEDKAKSFRPKERHDSDSEKRLNLGKEISNGRHVV
ncbi:hypothetical protein HZH66_002187 [Vespula vulgaris]|uniref:Uncharacterized protein n=1 Tax=Vespula vulgaris TaxID=7454 RepID=A0A834KJ85_VESVU|nr:hypothetical protein HZH66_002187 [Vespula vulgaris]